MGFKAVEWAFGLRLSPTSSAVLVALAHRADDATWEAFPGQETLQEMTGLALRSVTRALKDLEQLGAIRREERRDPRSHRKSSDLCMLSRDYSTDSQVTDSQVTPSHTTEGPESHATVSKVTRQSGVYIEDQPEDQSKDQSVTHPKSDYSADFDAFWTVYPRHEAKAAAQKAYLIARRTVAADVILAGAHRYARLGLEKQYIKLPAGWIRDRRWEDDTSSAKTPNGRSKHQFVAHPEDRAPRRVIRAGVTITPENKWMFNR